MSQRHSVTKRKRRQKSDHRLRQNELARDSIKHLVWPIMRKNAMAEAYQWLASFPADLWPAEEEETADGIYLRLKDGTRLLAEEFSWRKSRNVAG